VAEIARRAGKTITSVPKKTMDGLMSWHWPGNVRELENFSGTFRHPDERHGVGRAHLGAGATSCQPRKE